MRKLRSHDHSAYTNTTWYLPLRDALFDLIASNDSRDEPLTYDQITQLVIDCTLTATCGDCCDTCQDTNQESNTKKYTRWPYETTVIPSGPDDQLVKVVCSYRCHECGTEWTSNFLLDPAVRSLDENPPGV